MAVTSFYRPATLRPEKEDSFIRRVERIGYVGLALCSVLLVAGPAAAEDAIGSAKEAVDVQTAPSPVKMNPEKLAGVDLTPGEPFLAPENLLEGSHRPRGDFLYSGKELIVEVFEDDPGIHAITEPFPVDEFVTVLSGKLVLTDADGRVQAFVAGDSLMVPKGFTGT